MDLAKATGIPLSRINQIVAGHRSITAETDLRLCRAFGFSDGYFSRLQLLYDMRMVIADHGKEIEKKVRPLAAKAG